MMAPNPMMAQAAPQKEDDPTYIEVKNSAHYCCKKRDNKECIRIPNTKCDANGCHNNAYEYCNGQYKWMASYNGAVGPTFWHGCGRMLCQSHMAYYNWGDGQNHVICCKDREECEGKIKQVWKHHVYACFCPFIAPCYVCFGDQCEMPPREYKDG
jgi:hypothetical protein